jgi:DNA repair exonuclease SbcCD ATPase subunit
MTAILGANGSGKSNLMGAVSWLLTGENPNEGVKDANVSQLAGGASESYGELLFSHLGKRYSIVRYLRPAKKKATFHCAGVKVAEGEEPVTQAIAALLQLDTKVIKRFVIVAQNDIYGFIDDKASEVDKFFQRLFDTAAAGKASENLGKHLNKIQIPNVTQVPELTQEVQQLEQELAACHTQILRLRVVQPDTAMDRDDYELINKFTRREHIQQQLQHLQVTAATTNTQLQSQRSVLAKLGDDQRVLQLAIEQDTPGADKARAALANWQMYQNWQQQKEALARDLAISTAELTTREAKLADLVLPTAPVQYLDLAARQALEPTIQQLQYQLQRDTQLLHQFNNTGVAECPTCHTPTDKIEHLVEAAKQSTAELSVRLNNYRMQINESTDYEWRYNGILTRQQNAREAISTQQAQHTLLQQRNASMTEQAAPLVDTVAAQLVIQHVAEYRQALTEMQPRLQQLRREVNSLEVQCQVNQTTIDTMTAELVTLTATAEDASAANQRILLRQQAATILGQSQAEQARLTTTLQFKREALATMQQQVRSAEVLTNWVNHMGEVRALCAAAPQFVAQHNLQLLQADVNEILSVLEFDFRVTADQGLSFTAHFHDGRSQPAVRLSNGQKVGLALAFRVAVNSMFAAKVGLLALDEPTAWLDKQRIRALAPVLEKLRRLTTSRGLQCIIVTHEDELAPLFDTTITL